MKTDLDRRIEAAKKWIYKRSIDLPNAFRDSDEVLHELLDKWRGRIKFLDPHSVHERLDGEPALVIDAEIAVLTSLSSELEAALSKRKKP